MSRCDHCTQRFTWDCEDWRPADNVMCDNFELDWKTLSPKFKEIAQEVLIARTCKVECEVW